MGSEMCIRDSWQAWDASVTLADAGQNPYDVELLNAELSTNPIYGPDGVGIGDQTLVLFNPPTWLVHNKVLGFSFLLTLTGGLVFVWSIVWLTKDSGWSVFLGALGGMVLFNSLGFNTRNFALGQTGFVLAGLIGLQLVLSSTRFNGVSLGLLAFKPHIAVAVGVVEFIRKPKALIQLVLSLIHI